MWVHSLSSILYGHGELAYLEIDSGGTLAFRAENHAVS